MKTYNALVDEIANLHSWNRQKPPVVPTPLVLANQWIPTVIDTGTAKGKMKLPVIVAIGANYATGFSKMPSMASAKHRLARPWVEDKLSRNRLRAVAFLKACSGGRVRKHWNGLLPYDPDKNYYLSVTTALNPMPHFVMTNLSPWITNRDWAAIRDNSLEDLFAILAAPRMGSGGLWAYFRQLKKCVGTDAIWIGHGNADVFGFFRLICWKLKIRMWFFDSNLSQKSLMILPS